MKTLGIACLLAGFTVSRPAEIVRGLIELYLAAVKLLGS